jgi:hypothetical protein
MNVHDREQRQGETNEQRNNREQRGAAETKRSKVKPKPAKKAKATPAATKKSESRAERSNKKAEVIALMKRTTGATLAEIMNTTGWQAHTVRGFVSILGKKGGEKIESSKSAAGERTYKIK